MHENEYNKNTNENIIQNEIQCIHEQNIYTYLYKKNVYTECI